MFGRTSGLVVLYFKELIMSFGSTIGKGGVKAGGLLVRGVVKVGYGTGGFLSDIVDGGVEQYAVEEAKVSALITQLDEKAAVRAAQREAAKAQALANYHAAQAAKQQPLGAMAVAAQPDATQAQAMIDQLQTIMAQAAALQAATAK